MSDLRARLRALVEEWRKAADMQTFEAANAKRVCALDLAALLDETEEPAEPEPCSEWRHCEHEGEDGHLACDVLCADCGMRREAHKTKPLPLGHPFEPYLNTNLCAYGLSVHGDPGCGQPREAHE